MLWCSKPSSNSMLLKHLVKNVHRKGAEWHIIFFCLTNNFLEHCTNFCVQTWLTYSCSDPPAAAGLHVGKTFFQYFIENVVK